MISPWKDMSMQRKRGSEERYCSISSLSKIAGFKEPKGPYLFLSKYKTLESKSVRKFCCRV
jgi:hypothetical protein